MWKSACCLFFTLVLAIIGVSLDVLMVQKGTTLLGTIEITLDYGWQSMEWTIDVADYNYTESISYDDAYNEYCNSTAITASTMCTDLQNTRDAGRVYIAFNIIGIFLLTISLAIAVLGSLGKCLCSCRCHIAWITSILCTLSLVCFLIAFGVFLSDFSENTDKLITEMTHRLIDWQSAYIGSSIGCLIGAVCLGLISLTCILFVDRHHWRNRQQEEYEKLYGQHQSGFPVNYGGPPPPIYPIYGQPPPYGMPPPGPPPPGMPVPLGSYYEQVPYNNNITPV